MTTASPEEKYGAYGPGRLEGFRPESNVRELGGYEVVGGRRVRHGLFVRSGALALLAPDELERWRGLGVRADLDLRSAGEAAAQPDPEIEGMAYVRRCAMRDLEGNEIDFSPTAIDDVMRGMFADTEGEVFENAGSGEADDPLRDVLDALYVAMPFGNPAYQQLFAWLREGVVPLEFHCTAGKDRTGVGAMLILLALGASEDDVLFDYALTNAYRRSLVDEALERAREFGELTPERETMVTGMQGVDPAMARMVLDAILERYGSYDAYFSAEFGLDGAGLADLRERYTE